MSLIKSSNSSPKKIASVENLHEDSIRMNIDIPKTFYKEIKQKALNQDMTIKTFVLKSLKDYMSK
jgi:hypothetical protein